MLKIYLTAIFLLFLCLVGNAQKSSLKGRILDVNDGSQLAGANVILSRLDSTSTRKGTMTSELGYFQFDEIIPGSYELKITYLGFSELIREIQFTGIFLDLGDILLVPDTEELDEAVVEGRSIRATQKGDTLQYNADSYKTLADASAEELLEKMPTVTIQNGEVQAEGEEVRQVLVDGKRFFGNDPTAALRNLPAEVIDKIEIFDQQSEQAQFTGFDDGQTTKTINIVTRSNMRNGQFGKVYAGHGTDDRYQAGGNINIFDGDQRISLIGMANNLNQQNFSSEDLLGVVGGNAGGRGRGGGRGGRGGAQGGRPGGNNSGASASDFLVGQQDGITSSQAFGINFSDSWGKNVELSASYFFNRSENRSNQLTSQQFFDETGFNELYEESSNVTTENINHRLNSRLDVKLDDQNSLLWRPSLSFQSNSGIQNLFGQTLLGSELLNQTNNDFDTDYSAISFNNDLLWRHRFQKDRRTLSIRVNTGYAPKRGESILLSENIFSDEPDMVDQINQMASLDQYSWNGSADLQYTEPLTGSAMMLLNYRYSQQQEISDKQTFDFDQETSEYDLFNPNLSNIFSNDYTTHLFGIGYNYRKKGLMLMARANVQNAELLNEQESPLANTYQNSFFNLLPLAMLRYNFSRNEKLRVFYRSNTQLPSITQLQNVLDNTNPLQLAIGNPELSQSLGHNLSARYSKTNAEKGAVFFALISGTLTQNYIANSIYLSSDDLPPIEGISVADGAQLTLPVNLDGQWSVRTFLTYGFPVAPLKSNLNIDFTANISSNPGLISGNLNRSNNTTLGLGLTLGSNFSDRIDFTLSSRSNFNTVDNSLLTTGNTSYFNQYTRLKFNAVFRDGFVFRNDVSHQFYSGLEDEFDQNFLLWNLSIGKKVFKNDRGEISLSVFDLLNQNNSLSRNITETFIEDVQTNVLQQYFMLGFTYNLRHFRINPSR